MKTKVSIELGKVGWVWVYDRLPEKYKLVLIYDETVRGYDAIGLYLGWLDEDERGYFWNLDNVAYTLNFEEVKYWSPLLDVPSNVKR